LKEVSGIGYNGLSLAAGYESPIGIGQPGDSNRSKLWNKGKRWLTKLGLI
jgi:hypothetical protein